MTLWIIATLSAFFIKGLCGFANTLIFTSIIGFGSNNVNISPVELVLGYPTNLILVWKNRARLDIKVVLPLAIIIIAGSIPGALLLKNVNVTYLKIFFGVLTSLIGVEMLLEQQGKIKVKESKILMLIIGITSGVLCGLFGIGILMAAYVNRIAKDSGEFKANLCAVFAIENTFRIILYNILHVITLKSLKTVGMMAPFMLIALFGGIRCSKLINEKYVKTMVMVLLVISGVALVVSQI